ncbi:MAG: hypothetical protein HXS46_14985 [Theionarchaea archaeon]|nr:hypothetical protein [Theionarchaea archaeon]
MAQSGENSLIKEMKIGEEKNVKIKHSQSRPREDSKNGMKGVLEEST